MQDGSAVGVISSRRPLGGHNPPAIVNPSPLLTVKPSAATPSDTEGLEAGEESIIIQKSSQYMYVYYSSHTCTGQYTKLLGSHGHCCCCCCYGEAIVIVVAASL